MLKAFTNKPTCFRYRISLCPASPDILSISLLQCASFQGLCPQESLLLCTSVFPQVELGLIGNPPKYCRYTEWDPLLQQRDTAMPQVHHWKTQVEQADLLAKESVQFSSVQSCPTLCDPMNSSTPGLPVHHQLPEFTQTHVHRVSDAILPSHPLSSPSPPTPNPSQHQSLFQRVNTSHEVAKVLEFQPQH